ncbi:sugar phosphate isomerase/epimerase family protein [Paenibacillus senegalensis]|uniref:sugar phosphate isomerase/epimerase family protein n=1 Tax=Paenibacillus senegalensis TaxID=1465766 RepID=UPI000288B0AC|nr:sugar phosphate isomerase/epimerase family protein [Paenibacillus senegalensis]
MKLSFTTLGCPDWDLETIVTNAKAYGYDGVDFRGLQGEMEIYNLPEFSSRLEETKQQLREAGLEITCFSSSVKLFNVEGHAANLEEITRYAKLCEQFGTRYIRVFGGRIGETDRQEAARSMAQHLQDLSRIAKAHGVTLLLETHDDWLSHEDVSLLLDLAGNASIDVLWDVHHPYRMLSEQPEETWKALGSRIKYTHWKDSLPTGEQASDFRYCLTGEGDIPLKEIYRILEQGGYDGWFTFEWEKKWHPDIHEPEVSLPQYVEYMRKLEQGLG